MPNSACVAWRLRVFTLPPVSGKCGEDGICETIPTAGGGLEVTNNLCKSFAGRIKDCGVFGAALPGLEPKLVGRRGSWVDCRRRVLHGEALTTGRRGGTCLPPR